MATNCPPRATFIVRHNLTKFVFLHTITSDKSHYENVPFEIPESWCWCTLSELCIFLSRGKSPKYSEERLFPVFAQKCNLKDGGISLDQARFLDPSTIEKWGDDYKLKSGDVLVNSTGTGTVGRTRLFDECCLGEYPFVVPDSHVSVVRTATEIDSFYIWAILSSNWGQQYLEDNLAGSTNQKELYIGVLEDMFIPLPPKNEQKKIAKEIARWGKYVDNIDVVKAELSNYVKQTKSQILDLAISGKLVPQDPNDEPAIELLRRINPAFKPCDNSHYENLPFEIPSTWVWVSHNDMLEISGGAQPPKSEFSEVMKPGYIRLYQIRDYGEKPIPIYIPLSTASKTTVKGDILLARYGGSLGKVFIAEDGAYNVAMAKVILCYPEVLNQKFVYYYYLSSIYQNKLRSISRTAQAGFNSGDFEDMYFPLPPLDEQGRIVDAISSIWEMIDMITAEL